MFERYRKIDGKVYAVAWREFLDARIVCPFCRQFHRHSESDGFKSVHCVEKNKQVVIDWTPSREEIRANNSDGYFVETIYQERLSDYM